MKCPYCQVDDDRVTDSRGSEDGFAIRRKRQCQACKRAFTTYERVERIKCPFCQENDNRVVESRASELGFTMRRWRQCQACRRCFTTYERVERASVKVVKKDGSRVPFDRNKLKQGIEKACWKRPIPGAKLEAIVDDIEDHVEAGFESEVESRYLGELMMRHLRELDQVAYVRFASVYRQFEDAHDFVDELRPMLSESPRPPE